MRTLPDDDTDGIVGSDSGREAGPDRWTSGDGAGGRYRIQALDRALGILALVGRRPDLGLQALAERSGTSVSQVLKILATLEGHGLVAKGADKTYRLGYGAMRLGHLAARLQPVVGVAALVLDELREETGESIHLVVRDGLDAVIADVRESSKTVRVVSPVGERTRLNAGSAGKLFLAHGSRELMAWLVREPMPAYTELSETDPELLRIDVDRARRQGVCVAIGDFEDGAFSVAAPVFEEPGRMVAAIALAGPLSRFDSGIERRYRTAVKRAAAIVGQRLGAPAADAADATVEDAGLAPDPAAGAP
jgi:IclR family KDG regulon transcriptional repressor